MLHRVLVLAALVACDSAPASEPQIGDTKPPPAPTCREIVCDVVPACAPVQTGGVDFTTEAACLDGSALWDPMPECYEPEACLGAVAALPCPEDTAAPTQDELDALTRAFVEVRRSCLGPPY